eukprot:10014863-Alexandrium_andersonii.AAC.1
MCIRDSPALPETNSVFLRGPTVRSSRVSTSMSTEAVVSMLGDVCPLPELASRFETIDKVVATDEHASNIAAERHLDATDARANVGKHCSTLSLLCDVHK